MSQMDLDPRKTISTDIFYDKLVSKVTPSCGKVETFSDPGTIRKS